MSAGGVARRNARRAQGRGCGDGLGFPRGDPHLVKGKPEMSQQEQQGRFSFADALRQQQAQQASSSRID